MRIGKLYIVPLVSISLTASLLLTSCFKEDDIVPVHKPGSLETVSVELGEKYHQQVFFELSSYSIMSSNTIFDWDLAFESDKDSWHVVLNSAKMMYAGNSFDTSFINVNSSAGLEMKFDNSNGDFDSTAIGEWYFKSNDSIHSHNNVYVIDRGFGTNAQNIGEKKIIIDIIEENYQLRYADLDGSNEHYIIIEKDPDYHFVYFSFDTGTLKIAPKKDNWSLKFTKYATMLTTNEGDQYPYLVTGVLLNPHNTSAVIDTTDFLNIELEDTINHTFSKDLDTIGYDWKYYSFDDELYTIVPNRNYIVKNYDGCFFKLRFIDFYDENGVKGTVTFEVVRL
jgi:hypothetical protein